MIDNVPLIKAGDWITCHFVDDDGHKKISRGEVWESDQGDICIGPVVIRNRDGKVPTLLTLVVIETTPSKEAIGRSLTVGDYVYFTTADTPSPMIPDGIGSHCSYDEGYLWKSDDGALLVGPTVVRHADGTLNATITHLDTAR